MLDVACTCNNPWGAITWTLNYGPTVTSATTATYCSKHPVVFYSSKIQVDKYEQFFIDLEDSIKQRRAQIRLWSLEAIQRQSEDLQGACSPERPEKKYGLSRQHLKQPVRRPPKRRVCAGSSRYRVMV